MKIIWDSIVSLVILVIIAVIIYKVCNTVKSSMHTWKQGINQIDESFKQSNEVRKDPPNIEQVIIEPEQASVFEPVTLKVSGRKLEHKFAHWVIAFNVVPRVPENEFNAIETKYVFVKPGTYEINSQNYWMLEISSSEPEVRQITKYAYISPRNIVANNLQPHIVIDYPKYWVDENAEFIINASKSYDSDGKIARYFIQFGDGTYREGQVLDGNSLVFHHIYPTESIMVDNNSVTCPHYFTLILYDDKNDASYFSDVIYVLTDYHKEKGFLDRNGSMVSPDEYFNKHLKNDYSILTKLSFNNQKESD